jgi:hypothetical protein
MHWTRRLELALRTLTALSAAIAVVALAWPVSVPEAEIAPGGLDAEPAAPRHPERAGAGLAQAVAQGNIFSTTRSAPRVRYRPLGPAAGAEVSAEADAAGGGGQSGVPQLYGIVPGTDGAAALLRLDPAVPGALLYRTGDRGGRYRVDEIGERSVVLTGPAGRVELRLPAPLEAAR